MGRFGGKAENERALTSKEIALIKRVFKTARLPSLLEVSIGDGLSATGTPWTDSDYQINVGPQLFEHDLSSVNPDVLVHEMTHVWQYFNGTLTKWDALRAHALYGAARRTEYLYDYTLGDSWDDFGFEGQAQMVEDWFTSQGPGADNMSQNSLRYVYIRKVLYAGDRIARELTLEELQDKPPEPPDPSEIQFPDRQISFVEDYSYPTDFFLKTLEKRFAASDIPGLAKRVKQLEVYCRWFRRRTPNEAVMLAARLEARSASDKLAQAFHYNLSTPTRNNLG